MTITPEEHIVRELREPLIEELIISLKCGIPKVPATYGDDSYLTSVDELLELLHKEKKRIYQLDEREKMKDDPRAVYKEKKG